MPLRKAEKIRVAKKYADVLQAAPNAVVVQYDGIGAEEMNALKAQVKADGGEIFIVKKRLLLKSLESAGATAIERDLLPGSILLVAAPAGTEDEFATLKIVNKVAKTLKKKDKEEKKNSTSSADDSIKSGRIKTTSSNSQTSQRRASSSPKFFSSRNSPSSPSPAFSRSSQKKWPTVR